MPRTCTSDWSEVVDEDTQKLEAASQAIVRQSPFAAAEQAGKDVTFQQAVKILEKQKREQAANAKDILKQTNALHAAEQRVEALRASIAEGEKRNEALKAEMRHTCDRIDEIHAAQKTDLA